MTTSLHWCCKDMINWSEKLTNRMRTSFGAFWTPGHCLGTSTFVFWPSQKCTRLPILNLSCKITSLCMAYSKWRNLWTRCALIPTAAVGDRFGFTDTQLKTCLSAFRIPLLDILWSGTAHTPYGVFSPKNEVGDIWLIEYPNGTPSRGVAWELARCT
jgi:hypothetical protein